MLYTTKEIADRYGGEQKNVTPYMITHTWIPNGLKYMKGKGKGFLFKLEWVEEYLEEQTSISNTKSIETINILKGKRKSKNRRSTVCTLKKKERRLKNEKKNR